MAVERAVAPLDPLVLTQGVDFFDAASLGNYIATVGSCSNGRGQSLA